MHAITLYKYKDHQITAQVILLMTETKELIINKPHREGERERVSESERREEKERRERTAWLHHYTPCNNTFSMVIPCVQFVHTIKNVIYIYHYH